MGRHQNTSVLPDKFFRVVAEDARCCGVRRLDRAFLIDDNNTVDRRIDDGAEPRFARAQPVLRPLLIGDVAGRDNRAGNFSAAVTNGREIVAAYPCFARVLSLQRAFGLRGCFTAKRSWDGPLLQGGQFAVWQKNIQECRVFGKRLGLSFFAFAFVECCEGFVEMNEAAFRVGNKHCVRHAG